MHTMNQQKLLMLQEKARENPEFQRLSQEYQLRDLQLQLALKTMDTLQQNAVTDYIGLLIEMQTNLLLMACG